MDVVTGAKPIKFPHRVAATNDLDRCPIRAYERADDR
jgi:hypothetical protein